MVGNYGVDPTAAESRRPHARAVVMREARGPALDATGCTGTASSRSPGSTRARSSCTCASAARCARPRSPARPRSRRRSPRSASSRRWPAARSATGVSTPEPYVYSRRGHGSDRGRRLRLQALDPRPARVGRRGGDGLSRTTPTRTSCARFDGVLLSNGPGDPEPLVAEVETVARAARPRAGARHLPRPPAARARDRPRDVQAPVRPPRREPPGARAARRTACSSRARTTASRSRRSDDARGDARLALRRHGRGARVPGARARARCSSTRRRGPGRTTRGRCSRDWVEEVRTCRSGVISARSA